MCHQIFGEKVKEVDYVKRPGAYGIMFNKHNQVGIIRTSRGHFLPGGGIEVGEEWKECLLREIIEETGHEAEIIKFLDTAIQYTYSTVMDCHLKIKGYFCLIKLGNKITDKIEDDHELVWLDPIKCDEYMLLKHQAWAIKEGYKEYQGLTK